MLVPADGFVVGHVVGPVAEFFVVVAEPVVVLFPKKFYILH